MNATLTRAPVFLLQMFGHRLVEHMHAHGTRPQGAAGGQDESLAAAFDTVLSYVGSDASVSDLLDAIRLADHPDPESALACDALAVFDVEAAGAHRIEPHPRPLRRSGRAVLL